VVAARLRRLGGLKTTVRKLEKPELAQPWVLGRVCPSRPRGAFSMLRLGAVAVALLAFSGGCSDATTIETTAPLATPTVLSTTSTSTTVAESTSTSEFFSTTSTTEPFEPMLFCLEEPPPPYGREESPYQFDASFYTHYCSASGIFVVGSENAPIEALEAAAQIVDRMLRHDPLLVAEIVRSNHAVILTGVGETAADLPEWVYEEGRTHTPDPNHPGFASSGGGMSYTVSPADDVLCEGSADKRGSYGTPDWGSVLVHELGHLVVAPAGISGLDALFDVGAASGAWDLRHYAMTNSTEYWAEVVQVYLGQYEQRVRGYTQPETRAELREKDPTAFDLASRIFGGATLLHYWCDVYDGPVIDLPEVPSGPESD